jgi:hypothetical protein
MNDPSIQQLQNLVQTWKKYEMVRNDWLTTHSQSRIEKLWWDLILMKYLNIKGNAQVIPMASWRWGKNFAQTFQKILGEARFFWKHSNWWWNQGILEWPTQKQNAIVPNRKVQSLKCAKVINAENEGEISANNFLRTEELSIINLFPQHKQSKRHSAFRFWYVMVVHS